MSVALGLYATAAALVGTWVILRAIARGAARVLRRLAHAVLAAILRRVHAHLSRAAAPEPAPEPKPQDSLVLLVAELASLQADPDSADHTRQWRAS